MKHIRLLREAPIEVSILLGVLLVWFGVFQLFQLVGFSNSGSDSLYAGIGHSMLVVAGFVFLMCFVTRLVNLTRIRSSQDSVMYLYHRCVQALLYSGYLILLFVCFTYLVTGAFMTTNVEYTARMSLEYFRFDAAIGVYDYLSSLIEFSETYPIFYNLVFLAYDSTVGVIVLAIFILALFSAKLARAYGVALLFTVFVSLPFWIAFPAIAPHQLSTTDSFAGATASQQITDETVVIRNLSEQYAGTRWVTKTTEWRDFWEQTYVLGFGYPVSCNPSMHVMWGVLMVVYFFRANRWLGVSGLIYLVFEIIGTVFFLQHYVIDIFTGIVFALVVLPLVSRCLRYEAKNMDVRFDNWFAPLIYIERFGKFVTKTLTKKT